ncbi:MAG: hypothetical protein ACK5TK_10055 [Betaproteobacteria bacterium]
MESYLHRVVGIYPALDEAHRARDLLIAEGMPSTRIRVLTADSTGAGMDAKSDSDDVLKDLLRDGAIGTAVGTAAGAGVSIALAAANLTLFIASPVLGALYLIGWGASLGGLVGAVVGAERSKGDVSTLIKDALASGQVLLVVHACTEAETTLAQQLVSQQIDPPAAPRSSKTEAALLVA